MQNLNWYAQAALFVIRAMPRSGPLSQFAIFFDCLPNELVHRYVIWLHCP